MDNDDPLMSLALGLDVIHEEILPNDNANDEGEPIIWLQTASTNKSTPDENKSLNPSSFQGTSNIGFIPTTKPLISNQSHLPRPLPPAHRITAFQSKSTNKEHPYQAAEFKDLGQGTFIYRHSGLQVKNPLVSSSQLESRLKNKSIIPIANLLSHYNQSSLNLPWCTIAVVGEVSHQKETAQGSPYCIWKITDLKSTKIPIFLFDDAFKAHQKEVFPGTLIAVIGAKARKSGRDGEFSITIDKSQELLPLGHCPDFTFCKARTRNGSPCRNPVHIKYGFCAYHISAENKKISKLKVGRQELAGGHHYTTGITKPKLSWNSGKFPSFDNDDNRSRYGGVTAISREQLRHAAHKLGHNRSSIGSQYVKTVADPDGVRLAMEERERARIKREQELGNGNTAHGVANEGKSSKGSSHIIRDRMKTVIPVGRSSTVVMESLLMQKQQSVAGANSGRDYLSNITSKSGGAAKGSNTTANPGAVADSEVARQVVSCTRSREVFDKEDGYIDLDDDDDDTGATASNEFYHELMEHNSSIGLVGKVDTKAKNHAPHQNLSSKLQQQSAQVDPARQRVLMFLAMKKKSSTHGAFHEHPSAISGGSHSSSKELLSTAAGTSKAPSFLTAPLIHRQQQLEEEVGAGDKQSKHLAASSKETLSDKENEKDGVIRYSYRNCPPPQKKGRTAKMHAVPTASVTGVHNNRAPAATAAAAAGKGSFADAFSSVIKEMEQKRVADPSRSSGSLYKNLVENEDAEKLGKIMDALERKDEIASQMDEIQSLKVSAWKCSCCDMISEYQSQYCREKHPQALSKISALKRWWQCESCKKRFTTVGVKYPKGACPKCDVYGCEFLKMSMWKPEKKFEHEAMQSHIAGREGLLTRGVEQKWVNQ